MPRRVGPARKKSIRPLAHECGSSFDGKPAWCGLRRNGHDKIRLRSHKVGLLKIGDDIFPRIFRPAFFLRLACGRPQFLRDSDAFAGALALRGLTPYSSRLIERRELCEPCQGASLPDPFCCSRMTGWSLASLRSDRQLGSWAAFHVSCSVRIVSNLYSRGINYRQKVGDLLSDPESPSNIGQFSYPITVLC